MVSAGIGLLLIGILLIAMSTAMKGDGLTRNRAVGIRTRATMASDDAWQQGHQAAAPWVLSAGIFGVVMSVAAFTMTWAIGDGMSGVTSGVFVCVAFGALIALILVSTRVANRAARQAQ